MGGASRVRAPMRPRPNARSLTGQGNLEAAGRQTEEDRGRRICCTGQGRESAGLRIRAWGNGEGCTGLQRPPGRVTRALRAGSGIGGVAPDPSLDGAESRSR
ncbi:hypothetical protein KFL_005870020 [Klebsormidium nitens]|uniref:Uncharacterized protein n=1 Tax=Klebsormidium nitens TaxID=105231 RepID=A0A1Y1IH62_KLENI|nr:hypothetical protein KFL_005870020 [Klebsormidium nitens]|eukprot:GAQ89993.1 hypothetical protein KFL_005870020 [Klebsormidium nitens]